MNVHDSCPTRNLLDSQRRICCTKLGFQRRAEHLPIDDLSLFVIFPYQICDSYRVVSTTERVTERKGDKDWQRERTETPMDPTTTTPAPADFDAENADNFEDIEKQFAVKAVQHLEIYWKMLSLRPGSRLTFTKLDDQIFTHLCLTFPQFSTPAGVAAPLVEDEIKSVGGKRVWRDFMMTYEKTVDDYNFGSLLRLDCAREYDEENTIFVPRMQFLAIEIARNRFGLNDWVYERETGKKASEA